MGKTILWEGAGRGNPLGQTVPREETKRVCRRMSARANLLMIRASDVPGGCGSDRPPGAVSLLAFSSGNGLESSGTGLPCDGRRPRRPSGFTQPVSAAPVDAFQARSGPPVWAVSLRRLRKEADSAGYLRSKFENSDQSTQGD